MSFHNRISILKSEILIRVLYPSSYSQVLISEPSYSKEESDTSNEVKWEYKWEDKEQAEVHGPHTSKEMFEWQEAGFFQAGVFCRKVGTDGPFYSSKRIDFELYT